MDLSRFCINVNSLLSCDTDVLFYSVLHFITPFQIVETVSSYQAVPAITFVRTAFTKCTIIYSEQMVEHRSVYFTRTCVNWQGTFACQLSFKLSTSLNFDPNRVFFGVLTWLSRNWWQMRQTLLLPTHRKSHVTFRLAYLHFSLANSKDQGQGHAQFHW